MNKVNENKCNKDIKNYDGNVYELLSNSFELVNTEL